MKRYLLALIACLVTLGAGAGAMSVLLAQSSRTTPPPKKVTRGGRKGGVVAPTGWKEIDRLIEEQKLEEASQALAKLRVAARAAGHQEDWTRALVKEVQLRTALHGYETSVRFLKDEPWPEGFLARTTLQLFYAHTLVTYTEAYGWEIGQREKVETKGAVDLKAWTKEQIFEEAERAYLAVWKERERLGVEPVDRLSEYITPNGYPRDVRGTLRDAVSYLFVALLADTTGWRPEQQNELYALDLARLLQGDSKASAALRLDDPSIHPMLRIVAVLDDLEAWHASEGRRQAELEARLERLRRLHGSFTEEDDRARVRKDLEARLPAFREHAWWAVGMAELAAMVQQEAVSGNLVRARKLALEGERAYPGTIGAQRCRSLAASIEAPDFQVAAMSSDGPSQRSVEVSYKNLPRLFFRAYPLDLEKRIASSKDWNLLPQYNELRELVKTSEPVAAWTDELPATPDFKLHKQFVTPPLPAKGTYVLVASARRDFVPDHNRLVAAVLTLTDLVLLSRQDEAGGWEVLAVSGSTGRPLSGAKVSLYKFDWQKGHQRQETKTTGADGLARFAYTQPRANQSYFVYARRADDVALDAQGRSFWKPQEPTETTAALVYTDRSIYRPLQKLFWKVVAYRGRADQGRFQTTPEQTVEVYLVDPNHQRVETRTVKTNAFGSAAGEFVVPTGRLLGSWQVMTSINGAAHVRVEEYKRPTFEASFQDAKEPMRLNRPALLTGTVKYYFGLPVTSGAVKWRVTREPVYPWWWFWWWWNSRPTGGETQTVASGTSVLKEDGTFELRFTPQADERKAKQKEVSYRYRVTADVTDEGGETRSAERSFRLGFVAVEARVESETGFFREGVPAAVKITRTNLDSVPRPGKGSWRLLALNQPARALLPAEQASPPRGEDAQRGAQDPDFETPGDRQRPRWTQAEPWERTLRGWAEGREVAHGELSHDSKGEATAALGKLAPGAYRLRYQTTDELGATFETQKELLVAATHTPLALPALLLAESGSVTVGKTARLLVASGLPDQLLYLDLYRAGKLVERRRLEAARDASLIEIPVTEEHRGGFGASLVAVRDHQLVQVSQPVFVPWDDKELKVEFASFRDRLAPGGKETFRVKVSSPAGTPLGAGATELLAYMYDRSLDVFAAHAPPAASSLYPYSAHAGTMRANLGQAQAQWFDGSNFPDVPSAPSLSEDRLQFYSGYGIGGPGRRYRGVGGVAAGMAAPAPAAAPMMAAEMAPLRVAQSKVASLSDSADMKEKKDGREVDQLTVTAEAPVIEQPVALRADFSETAFWRPNLLTDGDGSASIEFTVPDSVTAWNVWVHALTRDLKGGSLRKDAQSVKDLMVRPYLPRFLREGDVAELKVVVNNASDKELKGKLTFEVFDPETNASLAPEFGLNAAQLTRDFSVKAGGGTNLSFALTAPKRVGQVAFKVVARAGDLSDGELRPLPLLPSRMHLVQSRFVTLRNKDRKVLRFADLAANDDPTRIDEQMVVTVDAQLFYTVLQALPYLINYPYECTEQTLNRFVSTGIVSGLYKDYPAIARMAQEFSKRDVPLETWDAADPNRKMALEETPWLEIARGGKDAGHGLVKVLDPRVAKAERDASLAKLRKAQTSLGAFPWWPGGPPSPYMTLYIMHGLAKASEFGVDVPKEMVQKGWQYLARYFRDELRPMMAKDCCWEFLSFLNYVASAYPDASWTGDALTMAERKEILDYCFERWKKHSPYLKGYLALTLKRMGRPADARLVWQSVMDSAKTDEEQGTHWAAEDRSWLWYNDTIETHAFALRTLMELTPEDPKRDGLVQWLLLNKKLNQWKSTRATAEVLYSLVHYLKKEGALGIREDAKVTVGPQTVSFVFEPDVYSGKKNQVVIPGDKVDPKTMSEVVVEKESKGFAFASATWHFSTDKLPAEDRGDFFAVSRRYFKREQAGGQWVLKPLADGAPLAPGDQVEVQVSLRSKHAAEYVHLRDPRAAGLEPENAVSRIKFDLGLVWYEETRDSGTNFFFEWLPQGEYTFKYRLRANMAGTFRVGPATVQSMYAPEFHAYSAGQVVKVVGEAQ